MGNDAKRDLSRQVATIVGALFQVLAGAIVPIATIAGRPRRLRLRDLGAYLPPVPSLCCLPSTTCQQSQPSAAACGLVLCRGVLPKRSVGGARSASSARGAAGDTCGHLLVPGRRLPAPRTF